MKVRRAAITVCALVATNIMLGIGLYRATATAQSTSPPPRIELVSWSDPAISISPLRGSTFEQLFQQAEFEKLGRYSVVLTNNTSEDIMALAVQWSAIGTNGIQVRSDGFHLSDQRQVVGAHQQIVLTPLGFRAAVTISVGQSLSAMAKELDRRTLSGVSTPVRISIDTAIFRNGLVVGPEETHYAAALEHQFTALQSLVSTVRTAMKAGGNVEAVLREQFARRPSFDPGNPNLMPDIDTVDQWMATYANELMRASTRRDVLLAEYEALPDLPTFFRR